MVAESIAVAATATTAAAVTIATRVAAFTVASTKCNANAAIADMRIDSTHYSRLSAVH